MAKMSECLTGIDSEILDSDRWIHFIEEHLEYIRSKSNAIEVSKEDAWRFRGDLYAYLFDKHEAVQYHYPIMRMNGWVRPSQFTENTRFLLKPSQQVIEELASDFVNEHRY